MGTAGNPRAAGGQYLQELVTSVFLSTFYGEGPFHPLPCPSL